jgi:hypothetical protein
MERAREPHHGKEAEAVKMNVLNVSLCNAHAKKTLAMTVRRLRVEVAGAPKGAIAILHPFAFETPFCLGHEFDSAVCCALSWPKVRPAGEKTLAEFESK